MSLWITDCFYIPLAGASSTGCKVFSWDWMSLHRSCLMKLLIQPVWAVHHRALSCWPHSSSYIKCLSKHAMTQMHKVPLFSSAEKNLFWNKRERGQRDMTTKELLPSLLGWLLFRKGKMHSIAQLKKQHDAFILHSNLYKSCWALYGINYLKYMISAQIKRNGGG